MAIDCLNGKNGIMTEAMTIIKKINRLGTVEVTPLPKRREDINPNQITNPVACKSDGNLCKIVITAPNCSQELRALVNDQAQVGELERICADHNELMLSRLAG